MRPIDLRPPDKIVDPTKISSGPSSTQLGAIGIAVLAVLGVGVFFALGKVDDMKSQSQAAVAQSQRDEADATSLQAQATEIGGKAASDGPQLDSLASSSEQELVSKVEGRLDYYSLLREINGTRPNTSTYYTSVDADSSEGGTVTLEGVTTSMRDLAALRTRVEATHALTDAHVTDFETRTNTKGRSRVVFTVEAQLVSIGESGVDTSGLVSNGSSDGGGAELSLYPSPQAKRTPKKRAPKSSLELAAAVAGGTS